jgi:hypothetical protein
MRPETARQGLDVFLLPSLRVDLEEEVDEKERGNFEARRNRNARTSDWSSPRSSKTSGKKREMWQVQIRNEPEW